MKPLAIVSMHASPIADLGSGENGGMNVYIRAVCEELGRRGIPTEVFTRRASTEGPDRVRLAPNSWVTQIKAGPATGVGKGRLFDLLPTFTEAILTEQRRRKREYSLVHSHYWLSGWAGSRLRDEWKLPWFHTFHTLARVKNERAAEGAVLEPDHRIAVEQSVVRNSNRLIASSVQEADDLVRLYGASRDRVAVVPPGVDLRLFGPRPSEALRAELGLGEARVIIFAGRLERLKGAETLVRAFGILANDGMVAAPLALVIIGGDSQNGASESRATGGERARLEALARELGIASQVRFVGAVDQPTLATYLNLASVCVVPSYSESFGLVALEAEACGTPVVAARVGGLPTIVKDGLTGYTLVSRDPARYADRIARLLSDEELRRCFSRRSRLVATQFTWQSTVDRLLTEYSAPGQPALAPAAAG
ncbi:MAG: glycosyltransferase [Candidatus Dormibacteraeota bacterium]|nr:glycosyltransferase [Candidatus Dormibacteraeota bacterium]